MAARINTFEDGTFEPSPPPQLLGQLTSEQLVVADDVLGQLGSCARMPVGGCRIRRVGRVMRALTRRIPSRDDSFLFFKLLLYLDDTLTPPPSTPPPASTSPPPSTPPPPSPPPAPRRRRHRHPPPPNHGRYSYAAARSATWHALRAAQHAQHAPRIWCHGRDISETAAGAAEAQARPKQPARADDDVRVRAGHLSASI